MRIGFDEFYDMTDNRSNASPDRRRGNPRRGTLGGASGIMINGEIELNAGLANRPVRNLDVVTPSDF